MDVDSFTKAMNSAYAQYRVALNEKQRMEMLISELHNQSFYYQQQLKKANLTISKLHNEVRYHKEDAKRLRSLIFTESKKRPIKKLKLVKKEKKLEAVEETDLESYSDSDSERVVYKKRTMASMKEN